MPFQLNYKPFKIQSKTTKITTKFVDSTVINEIVNCITFVFTKAGFKLNDPLFYDPTLTTFQSTAELYYVAPDPTNLADIALLSSSNFKNAYFTMEASHYNYLLIETVLEYNKQLHQ